MPRRQTDMKPSGSVSSFADRPASLKLLATISADQQAMIEFKGSHFEPLCQSLRLQNRARYYPHGSLRGEATARSSATRIGSEVTSSDIKAPTSLPDDAVIKFSEERNPSLPE
jgi:hypothetical protein